MRINNLIPENTEGFGGEKPPSKENSTSNAKKTKRETAVSQRLINFALLMYKQLTADSTSKCKFTKRCCKFALAS